MAIAKGDAAAIISILDQTPEIPSNCQWCTFLRNHDELTVEMVTEEERQFLWNYYAPEPRMRLNLGIRRRLAPLMDGNINKIELLYAIVFSLPGTPIIYFGDEIGMGENIWLNDREGVRTPMQWSNEKMPDFLIARMATCSCR
jgi:maltose alpha-D-glucosyltransferase/alpha-amylase